MQIETLRTTALTWRDRNTEYAGGVVLIYKGSPYGWKDCLRDPSHEQPGANAVDESGQIFIAEGGDPHNGAKCWVAFTEHESEAGDGKAES